MLLTLAEVQIDFDHLPVWLRLLVVIGVVIGVFERLIKPLKNIQAHLAEQKRLEETKHKEMAEDRKKISYIYAQCSPNGKTSIFDKVEEVRNEVVQLKVRQRSLNQVYPIGIYEVNQNGEVVYVNSRYCEILGLPEADCLGSGWLQVIPKQDRERVAEQRRESREFHKDFTGEFRFQRLDGTMVYVMVRFMWAKDILGNIVGGTGTLEVLREEPKKRRTRRKPVEAKPS